MLARYFYAGMLLVAVISLAGCGKTLDQVLATGKSIIDIAGKTYEDVKDNYDTAKKLVTPASPTEPTK
jgi:hypothetical protein